MASAEVLGTWEQLNFRIPDLLFQHSNNMPFNFQLPTTSFLSFEDYLISSTHPSLPSAATAARGTVRNVLKKHKRLSPGQQTTHLHDVLHALTSYTPYLLALDAGLSSRSIADEEISITLIRDPEVQWRCTLTATSPGRDAPRPKLKSLEYEILLTLSAQATTLYLLARTQLHDLYSTNNTFLDSAARTAAVTAAMKHLLSAYSIFTYLASRASALAATTPPPVPDVAPTTFSALAALTIAEATLITVLKDDPYAAAVAQARHTSDTEWMYKAPSITSVRAGLFARLCIAAAEHGARGLGLLAGSGSAAGGKITEALPRYLEDLRRAARAKACRFLGIDAEMSGDTVVGIAWLRGARSELGLSTPSTTSGPSEETKKRFGLPRGLDKLKNSLGEKREDRRVERGAGGEWGGDAGRFEETRIVEMLLQKWEKMNDVMNTRPIPPSGPLLAQLPSGREYYNNLAPWREPSLDAGTLLQMRAPPSPRVGSRGDEADSEEEDEEGDRIRLGETALPGAFPGSTGGSGRAEGQGAYY